MKYSHQDILEESLRTVDTDIISVEDSNKIQKVDSYNGNSTSAESSDSSFDLEGACKESSLIGLINSSDTDLPGDQT